MKTILNKLLQGEYSFKRRISSPEICFDGVANFVIRKSNQRVYTEKGCYNKAVLFQQTQLFKFDSSNLYIHKSDGSLLHQFSIDEYMKFPIELYHIHHCLDDQYFLEMTIYSEDRFSTFYRINGPSKHYAIHTEFTKCV